MGRSLETTDSSRGRGGDQSATKKNSPGTTAVQHFFTAVLTVALAIFREDPDISGDLVRVRKREKGDFHQECAVAWDESDVTTAVAVEEV